MTAKQTTALRAITDWSNRIARPVGEPGVPGHSYTADEYEALRGADMYYLAGRALFTDLGRSQARDLAGGAPVVAYVHLLHTFPAAWYEDTAWPFHAAEGVLLDGTAILNREGGPAVRWRRGDVEAYHTDPEAFDPAAWAAMVVAWATEYGVDGLFLDNLQSRPWTYPQDPPVELEDGGLAYQAAQIRAVWELKTRAPQLLLTVNGSWAALEPGWTRSGTLADNVSLEKMGAPWWPASEALGLLRCHAQPAPQPVGSGAGVVANWRGRHLLDDTRGGRHDRPDKAALAEGAAASTGWVWSSKAAQP